MKFCFAILLCILIFSCAKQPYMPEMADDDITYKEYKLSNDSDSVNYGDLIIYIPNAFTPNGDGTNDFFTAKGVGIQKFKMEIYTRGNNLVFRTEDINAGWDGKAENKKVYSGIFPYKMEIDGLNGTRFKFLGSVIIYN